MRIMTPSVYRPLGVPTFWLRDFAEVFEALGAIYRERQCAKINGYLVTPYTAGLVLRVHSGMMPQSRKEFINRPLPQVIAVAMEIVG